MKKHVYSSLFLALGFSTAIAGTMGAIEPVDDFGGFYLGLGAGFINFSDRYTNSITDSDSIFSPGNDQQKRDNLTALLFHGVVGYGKMFAEKTYLGIKGSIDYSPFVDTSFNNGLGGTEVRFDHHRAHLVALEEKGSGGGVSMQPTYNIDLMLGYELFPHVLPFIEGGVSFSNYRLNSYGNSTRTDFVDGSSRTYSYNNDLNSYQTGYNVGIGSYFLVQKNWFLFSELVYTDMGKQTLSKDYVVPDDHIHTENRSNSIASGALSLFGGVSYLFPV